MGIVGESYDIVKEVMGRLLAWWNNEEIYNNVKEGLECEIHLRKMFVKGEKSGYEDEQIFARMILCRDFLKEKGLAPKGGEDTSQWSEPEINLLWGQHLLALKEAMDMRGVNKTIKSLKKAQNKEK